MLYVLLFTFYVDGVAHTYDVAEAETLSKCQSQAVYFFKQIEVKPDHVMCARKA